MPRLIWSPAAISDIQRLYRFLAQENKPTAQRAIKAIRTSVAMLEQHPQLGRAVAELPREVREWLIQFGDSGYIARYRVADNAVVVLAVWHQREAGL